MTAADAPDDQSAGRTLPRVSVAMCTCNGERFIDAQIASVLAQQGVQLELVIGDDASTDGTWPLLLAWAGRDARIRLLRQPQRLGLHGNLAQVLAQCSAGLIAPCDQDDVWHPQKLARLQAALQAGGHLLAYADSALVDEAGRPLGQKLSDRFHMFAGSGVVPLCFWNSVSGHAMLFRRGLLDTAGPGFPPGFLPDWWLAVCAAQAGSIVYLDTPLVDYRQHSASQTDVAQRKRAPRDSWRLYEERAARLAAMAGLRGPDQPWLQRLARLWAQRASQRLCWALVLHMTQRRQALMRLNRRLGFGRFALQMLAGQRWRPRTSTTAA